MIELVENVSKKCIDKKTNEKNLKRILWLLRNLCIREKKSVPEFLVLIHNQSTRTHLSMDFNLNRGTFFILNGHFEFKNFEIRSTRCYRISKNLHHLNFFSLRSFKKLIKFFCFFSIKKLFFFFVFETVTITFYENVTLKKTHVMSYISFMYARVIEIRKFQMALV